MARALPAARGRRPAGSGRVRRAVQPSGTAWWRPMPATLGARRGARRRGRTGGRGRAHPQAGRAHSVSRTPARASAARSPASAGRSREAGSDRGARAGSRPASGPRSSAEAIDRREGDLLLDASAGSGKTSVLVERFVQMVLEDGVDVSAILTITFTDKAAGEMRERIRRAPARAGAERSGPGDRGRVHLHDPCLLRPAAAAPRAAGRDRPAVPRARRCRGPAAGRRGLRSVARGARRGRARRRRADRGVHPGRPARSDPGRVSASCGRGGRRRRGCPGCRPRPDLEAARDRLREAAAAAASPSSGRLDDPAGPGARGARSPRALLGGDGCARAAGQATWPRLRLPGGNGAALAIARLPGVRGRARGLSDRLRVPLGPPRAPVCWTRCCASFGRRYAGAQARGIRARLRRPGADGARLCCGDEPDVREGLRSRFERIMVDELQDTNACPARADRAARQRRTCSRSATPSSRSTASATPTWSCSSRGGAAGRGGRAGHAADELPVPARNPGGDQPLLLPPSSESSSGRCGPGREVARTAESSEPRVELIVADRGADWDSEALSTPGGWPRRGRSPRGSASWSRAARPPQDIVVLLRAATDMRVYERALEERGIPTYMIGGRGYWAHPQVVDMVAYLRALANPRDLEALYTVLVSPLVGDLAERAGHPRRRERGRRGAIRGGCSRTPRIGWTSLIVAERARLEEFAAWFGRAAGGGPSRRRGADRSCPGARPAMTTRCSAMPGGQRRLANLRKLMRLGREHDVSSGDPLREFLELVRFRSAGWSAATPRESEAPVEGEGSDAVRLMTIHRAKGLEFEIVCVADLGRARPTRAETHARGSPTAASGSGSPGRGPAGASPRSTTASWARSVWRPRPREERRLFYVAMTRARERLILSGAAKLDSWPQPARRRSDRAGSGRPWCRVWSSARSHAREGCVDGVQITFVDESQPGDPPGRAAGTASAPARPPIRLFPPLDTPPPRARSPSHRDQLLLARGASSLRVPLLSRAGAGRRARGGAGGRKYLRGGAVAGGEGLSGAARGLIVHGLLEQLDFRRPVLPDHDAVARAAGFTLPRTEAERILALVKGFMASDTCARLGRATSVRSEQGFAFLLDRAHLPGGLRRHRPGARRRDPRRRLQDRSARGRGAGGVVERAYAAQRLIYAPGRAAGRGQDGRGRARVPRATATSPRWRGSARRRPDGSRTELARLTADMVEGRFPVSSEPHRSLCHGCPAEGGLCSWPLSATRRESPEQLF